MRISDWSSDVCSSDLCFYRRQRHRKELVARPAADDGNVLFILGLIPMSPGIGTRTHMQVNQAAHALSRALALVQQLRNTHRQQRSEEHTSELQSLMRISYAVFCLKNKNKNQNINN